MRVNVVKAAEAVRTSYWFIPSLMAFFAIVLGAVMVWLDAGPGAEWLDGLGWYQSVKAEGAHQVLSTIAGSMITVAGVVFSITIVAISFASSQYGPRILTNFMSDLGNKVTLGTFIATFLYCLVVLRTIRGGDEGEFVPQLAVMVGLLLAACSIGVLIYFIHHVPQTIHVNNVTRSALHQKERVEAPHQGRVGETSHSILEILMKTALNLATLLAVAGGLAAASAPAAAFSGNPCAPAAAAKSNPCAANPCSAKANPCSAKSNPCAANPCSAKANPCAANPCSAKKGKMAKKPN